MADLTAAAFRNPGHKYPAMCEAELGHLWVGPGWTDFAPELIRAVQKYLKKYNLPHEPVDAKNAIQNKIWQQNWAWLELRDQEAVAELKERAEPELQVESVKSEMPKLISEMTPEDQQAAREAMERAKKNLRRN